jgi:hypothetical protein
MKRTLLALAALLLTAGCSKAGVTVTGPGNLADGATGTIAVVVINDNLATPARTVTITASLFYNEFGVSKKLDSDPISFDVAASSGAPWIQPRWQLAQTPGVTVDWNSVVYTGDAINPRMDSAHVVSADSLAPGKSWTTTLKVKAGS